MSRSSLKFGSPAMQLTQRIDANVTVQKMKCDVEAWNAKCGLKKYYIKETAEHFYSVESNIAKAFTDFCCTTARLKVDKDIIIRLKTYRDGPSVQGFGYINPKHLKPLKYNYMMEGTGATFTTHTPNMYKSYQKFKEQQLDTSASTSSMHHKQPYINPEHQPMDWE